MVFDPDKEIEKIEEMKQIVRGHFDRSAARNAMSSDLAQRNGAAASAQAYAELVKAQADLYRIRKGVSTYKPAKI